MTRYLRNLLRPITLGIAFCWLGSSLGQVKLTSLPPDAAIAPASDALIHLWPAQPPGAGGVKLDLQVPHVTVQRPQQEPVVHKIARPVVSVYRAPKPDGSALLLISGGGYAYITAGSQVTRVAKWLAMRGTNVFVLLHRLPQDGWAAGPDTGLQDAQRAMRLIRSQAAHWRIDPDRIGVMGASAGGHLAGQLITRFDAVTYPPVDAADALSARPAFASLNYAVVTMGPLTHAGSLKRLLGDNPSADQLASYSNELHTRPDMPPTFLIHAADDASVPVENALMMFSAIRRVKADGAMHIFANGGHGFGLDSASGPTVQAWPDLFEKWAISHQMFRTDVRH